MTRWQRSSNGARNAHAGAAHGGLVQRRLAVHYHHLTRRHVHGLLVGIVGRGPAPIRRPRRGDCVSCGRARGRGRVGCSCDWRGAIVGRVRRRHRCDGVGHGKLLVGVVRGSHVNNAVRTQVCECAPSVCTVPGSEHVLTPSQSQRDKSSARRSWRSLPCQCAFVVGASCEPKPQHTCFMNHRKCTRPHALHARRGSTWTGWRTALQESGSDGRRAQSHQALAAWEGGARRGQARRTGSAAPRRARTQLMLAVRALMLRVLQRVDEVRHLRATRHCG